MSRNFKLLVDDIAQDKSIVLFCGAGINCSSGINLSWPDVLEDPFRLALNHVSREKGWNEENRHMLQNIFSSKVDEKILDNHILRLRCNAINDFPYEIRSAILKTIHSKQYIPLLQNYIYSICNKDKIIDSFLFHYARKGKNKMPHPKEGYEPPKSGTSRPSFHSLYILAKFILLYDKLEAIVTYNYDNFLTEAVKVLASHPDLFFYKPEYDKLIERWSCSTCGKLNVNVIDISGKTYDKTIRKNYITVFHVHGFIPPIGTSFNCDSTSIIFSQDEYCDTVSNIQTWQNAVQIHELSHYVCVFAGSSMTDLTVKRMIDFAHNNGNEENIYNLDVEYIIPKNLKGADLKYAKGKKLLAALKRDYLIDNGVSPITYHGDFTDLYEDLGKVIYLKSEGNLKGQNRCHAQKHK